MTKPIDALRTEIAAQNVDGFFIPHADEFLNEYTAPSDERLTWVTGFTGSAGQAIVMTDKAAFFTDGRYTLQARREVDARDFAQFSLSEDQGEIPTLSPAQWIEKNVPRGARLGVDPRLHAPAEMKTIKDAAAKAGAEVVYLSRNPVDLAWGTARPAPPVTPAVPHPLAFSGVPSSEKRAAAANLLREKGAAALIVTQPQDVCWLLNVRGGDLPHTPVTLSFAILDAQGRAAWFIDPHRLSPETRAWVSPGVEILDFSAFDSAVAGLARGGQAIWIDPAATPAAVLETISKSGGTVIEARSPLALLKARKNETERDGTRRAHIRDGVAKTRFLAAILAPGAAANHDELSAAALLEKCRSAGEHFRGLSFEAISGAGPNSAVIHYHPKPDTNLPLLSGPIYLIDSGGQYLDGTTDVTRAVAVDAARVTPEIRDRYTRVLKGHIQLAAAVFPAGTTGDVLDVKARQFLKAEGLDFAHGTGHGVGSYLSVHEGPCGISPRSTNVPLEPGFILSNEPGYYKEGAYGIRLENLVLVVDTGRKDAEGRALLGFETLTMLPFDRSLIAVEMLAADERDWLNAYHARVREALTPGLTALGDQAALAFLRDSTKEI